MTENQNQNQLEELTQTFLKTEKDTEELLKKLKDIQAEFKEALKLKNIAYQQIVDYLHGKVPVKEAPKEKKKRAGKKSSN